MIDLNDVNPGDVITIQDAHGNRAEGEVRPNRYSIDAFGVVIPFARVTRNETLAKMPAVRVTAHQPQIFDWNDR